MSVTSKRQYPSRLSSIFQNETSNYFTSILLKEEKTLEDAEIIYEKIKRFSFFHDFFAENLKKMELPKILNLCQGFKYETCRKEKFVYKQGDPSNEKFYIILSGEVAVINSQRIGDFGEVPSAVKSPSSNLLLSSRSSTATSSRLTLASSVRDLDRKTPTLQTIKEIEPSAGDSKKIVKRLNCINPSEETNQQQHQPGTGTTRSKPITKLRAVYDAVKALRTLQKCLPSYRKAGTESLGDLDKKETSTVATLQNLDEEENEEEVDRVDRKEFETFASSFGKVGHYLGVGESFGELALKKSTARPSSIMCRVDCEFLTLEKKKFDEVFGKIEREKEEFLKSVFPLLSSFSSANYNYLVCFFKTERYSKGSYIINEGKNDKHKAKFYVIQAGECVLEKKLLRELNNPYNAKSTLVSSYDNVQITVAGKGSFIGEEILHNKGEYEYSVKALTDIVLVQAISKKDFRLRFPQEFINFVSSMYETKKKHREEIFGNIKADSLTKMDKYKADNVYCIANASIANLTTNTAKHTFSRYMKRENKAAEVQPSNVLSLTISPRIQPLSYRESSLASVRSAFNNESLKETSPLSFRCLGIDISSRLSNSERKTQTDQVKMKIEFLSRIPSPPKQTLNAEENVIENAKILAEIQDEKDRKMVKIRLAQMNRQYNKADKKVSYERRSCRDPKNIILNRLLCKKEDIEYLQKGLIHHQLTTLECRESPKVPCITPAAQSTRCSFKPAPPNEPSSQKVVKTRPSFNPTSPGSSKKLIGSEIRLDNFNEFSLTECFGSAPITPLDIRTTRKSGSIEPILSKTMRTLPETEKILRVRKVKENGDISGDLSARHGSVSKTEGEKEFGRLSHGFDKEKLRKNITPLGSCINKRKTVPKGFMFSNSKAGLKDQVLHLGGDAKEWKKRVFRKPKIQGSRESLRISTENLVPIDEKQ